MRTKLFAAVAAAALALTGCSASVGSAPPDGVPKLEVAQDGDISASDVTLPDGRVVTCVVLSRYGAGGLSCDWDNASTPS